MKEICESKSSLYFDKCNFYKKKYINISTKGKKGECSSGMTKSLLNHYAFDGICGTPHVQNTTNDSC